MNSSRLIAAFFLIVLPTVPGRSSASEGNKDVSAVVFGILDEAGVQGARREYIVSQIGRNDIVGAISSWSEAEDVQVDELLSEGVQVEALNAEYTFLHDLDYDQERLRKATARAIPSYLTAVVGSERKVVDYGDFEVLLRREANVAGSGPPPPGLKRYVYGRLKVDCSPVDGIVTINGREVGTSEATFAVPVGEHRVKGRHKDQGECQGKVTIVHRRLSRLPCQLKKP